MIEDVTPEQVRIENIVTYVVNIAVSIVATLILFRARNVSLNLVKILCPLLILQQLAFCVARALLYQVKNGGSEGVLTRTGVSYGVVTAFSVMLLNLVHWIYAFKIWLLSKKIEWDIQKNKSFDQNTKCYNIIYYGGVCLVFFGAIGFGAYLLFDIKGKHSLWGAFLFDFAFTPDLVAVVLLLLAMKSIRKSLQNHPFAFHNINAMRAHNASFCCYGVAVALKMISVTLDSIYHKGEQIEKTISIVLFFMILTLNFVSLLILLFIFNGLVTIEVNRYAETIFDQEMLEEDRPTTTTVGGPVTNTESFSSSIVPNVRGQSHDDNLFESNRLIANSNSNLRSYFPSENFTLPDVRSSLNGSKR